MKKILAFVLKWGLRILFIFLLYLIIGAVLPYVKQPEIREETKAAFQAEQCYAGERTSPDGKTEVLSGTDRARIISENGEALDTRIQMIAHAKERVILSTFDFRLDDAGMDLLAALLDAADRGVQVEIFADGFNSWLRMEGNPYFYALSSHENGTIRLYNKMNPLKPWNLMGRMHDKYVIVDDTAYVLGGRNSFGYFLGDYPGHKNHDWDVLVYNTAGEADGEEADTADPALTKAGQDGAAQESSLYQVLDYYHQITALDCVSVFHDKSSLAEKKEVQDAHEELKERLAGLKKTSPELFEQEYAYREKTEETGKITLLSNPMGYQVKEPVVFYELMQLAQTAQEKVRIHTPYIMCSDMMYDEFAVLGSKLFLMTNSAANNGNPFGAVDYLNHKQDLLDTGMQILEYEGGISYHGKVMTVDDRLAVVGSFNMDMRSAYLDTELMLVIDSPEVNQKLQQEMDRYEADAALVDTVDTYRQIPEGMVMKDISTEKKTIRSLLGWLLEIFRFLL